MLEHNQLTQRKRLIDMAAGRIPVDLLFRNCRVVDVYSQKVRNVSLAVGNGKVIGFGEYAAREVVDAGSRYLLPGLIDAHVHIESSMLVPPQFARAVVACGTTTVVADPHEIANVRGLDGIRFMLDSSQNLPVSIRYMLPSCVPASEYECSGAQLDADDLKELLAHDLVLGIGEVMDFPGVVGGRRELLAKILEGEHAGKIVDGHAPGLAGELLSAYAVAGVRTDHECVTPEELRARVQRGMYVHIREGTAARNLSALVQGLTPAVSRRCTFCTDDREPQDIMHRGHINSLLQLAVANGLNPVTAVTMATLNAAECYGLSSKGALVPGRDADIAVVDDLIGFKVHAVYARGCRVVGDGALVSSMAHAEMPADLVNSVRTGPLSAEMFTLRLAGTQAHVIAIIPYSLITRGEVRPVVLGADGVFDAQKNRGLAKIAVIERHRASGKTGLGLLANYGISRGAVASTIAHDAHNIVVAGDNDADMLAAARRIQDIGGGIVLAKNGRILGELALPIGGLMCDRPLEEVGGTLDELAGLAHRELAINAQLDPFMTLSFMSLSVIPELKITASGLLDVTEMRLISVSA